MFTTLLKMAWRNIWRQRRRTLLTAAAISLALILSILARSLQEGSYAHNIDNGARFSSGLLQIQHPKFGDSGSIDDLVSGSEEFIAPLREDERINHIVPRIESFALAAGAERSRGARVMGVRPELEDAYARVGQKLSAGEYLLADDNAVLLGVGLARYLNVGIGDEVVLYGQGYRGQTAAGLYPIKGLLSFPMPGIDDRLVYMPLAAAEQLFSTDGQVTNWVVHTHTLSLLPELLTQVGATYPQYRVRDWEDMLPEMAQQISMDRAGGYFMMVLLYGVVGFGLFATLLMMTLERQREFGVMLATGLLRSRLMILIAFESLFIATLGFVMGLLVVLPVLLWLQAYPIRMTGEMAQMVVEMGFEPVIPALLEAFVFAEQVQTTLFILVLCLIYPLYRVYALTVVVALQGKGHVG